MLQQRPALVHQLEVLLRLLRPRNYTKSRLCFVLTASLPTAPLMTFDLSITALSRLRQSV